jgi:hypothetical protein
VERLNGCEWSKSPHRDWYPRIKQRSTIDVCNVRPWRRDPSHLADELLQLGMDLDLRLVASEHLFPRDHLAIDMLHHDVNSIAVSERVVDFRNRNGGVLSDELHYGRFWKVHPISILNTEPAGQHKDGAFVRANVLKEYDGGESAEAACLCGINRLRVRWSYSRRVLCLQVCRMLSRRHVERMRSTCIEVMLPRNSQGNRAIWRLG